MATSEDRKAPTTQRQFPPVLLSLLGGLVAGSIPAALNTCGSTSDGRSEHSEHPEPRANHDTRPSGLATGTVAFETNAISSRLQDAGGRRYLPSGDTTLRQQSVAPTPAESEALDQQLHADLIQQHRYQAVDASWARPTERRLLSGLSELAVEGEFSVGRVDCRSTLCSAELSWPSYDLARSHFLRVVEAPVPGCTRRITLPPLDDCTSTCDVTLIVDCQPLSTPTFDTSTLLGGR